MDQAAESFVSIGVAAPAPGYAVISNRLANVPDLLIGGWAFADTGASNPEQFFIQE